MELIKFIIANCLIAFAFTFSFGQSFTIDFTNYSFDGTHHELHIMFDVQGDFQKVEGDIELELTPYLYDNWTKLKITYPERFTAISNNNTYEVKYNVNSNYTKLQFTLTKSIPVENGVVSLIPNGGQLIGAPPYIKNGPCPVLAKFTTMNCSGLKMNATRAFGIAGNSDQLPFGGNCSGAGSESHSGETDSGN